MEIIYAQCGHKINSKTIKTCPYCWEKVIRIWTEEEIHGTDIRQVVNNWNKNRKPWELGIKMSNYYYKDSKDKYPEGFEREVYYEAYYELDKWQDENPNATEKEINDFIKNLSNKIVLKYYE